MAVNGIVSSIRLSGGAAHDSQQLHVGQARRILDIRYSTDIREKIIIFIFL